MDRRRFLLGAGAALAGVAWPLEGCVHRDGPKPAASPAPPGFPLLEVSGTPFEIGRAIGERFADEIREGLRRRKEWFSDLRAFVEQDPGARLEPFRIAAERHAPAVLEELRGWAEGSGQDFRDLLILNLYPELSALMAAADPAPRGCSTLALSRGERLLLAHNEDGAGDYADLMFLVRATPTGQPTFLCLTYPSSVCGNGPAMNSAGLVMTTNFISGAEVYPGVPRYFVSRMLLGATSLDQAVALATHPQRAYSFHVILGSRPEHKLLSVEVSAHRAQVHPVQELFVHTNHLVHPEMQDVPQVSVQVNTSSTTRYRVLTEAAAGKDLDTLDSPALVKMLSSHEGAPTSPCRHPVPGAPGATLACSLFDLKDGTWKLFQGNPCRAPSAMYQHSELG